MADGVRLADLTSLHVGGPARTFVTADDTRSVIDATVHADDTGEPLLVMSGGSNLVVSDRGFDGTVLRVNTHGIEVLVDGDDVVVTVAAGERWAAFVARCIDEGWSGVEALAGVPGSVGATPIQNVGAYGQEVSSSIDAVDVWDRATSTRLTLRAADCGFGYRTSRFKRERAEFVVLNVTFRLARDLAGRPIAYAELAKALGVMPGQRVAAREVFNTVLRLRAAKGMLIDPDDYDTWSVGSFFTNPIVSDTEADGLPEDAPRWRTASRRCKLSAAWLIEHSGFRKGFGADLTGGRATLSSKHALAITNRGSASTADILALARTVRDGVRHHFSVTLEPEPTLVACHV